MTNKTEVVRLHQAYPHWNTRKLAAALNCSEGYIRACRRRYGLDIPMVRGRKSNVFELGRAAMLAGLTVKDIETMGVGR